MIEYVIGDVQGCFNGLMHLLDHIRFRPDRDRLWFVGDLINRGPDSLKTIQWIRALPHPPRIVLGNHDLHLLHHIFHPDTPLTPQDTFQDILASPDKEVIGHWLRQQSILYHDSHTHTVMTHAGIYPYWTLPEAIHYAKKLETMLRGDHFIAGLPLLYGNEPMTLEEAQTEEAQLRFISNAFTRMRYCDLNGALRMDYKGPPEQAPSSYTPWFLHPKRRILDATLFFGHWAALKGLCPVAQCIALDTGYVWGQQMTAYRLDTRQRFAVFFGA